MMDYLVNNCCLSYIARSYSLTDLKYSTSPILNEQDLQENWEECEEPRPAKEDTTITLNRPI